MSDNDYRFGFGKDKIEINKLKHDGLWRINLNNNNNLVECSSAHTYGSIDGEEQSKIQRTMAKTKQKQTTTTAAAAAAGAATAATTTTTATTAIQTAAAATTIGAVAITPTCVAHIEDEGGGDETDGAAADDDDGDCAVAAASTGLETSDKLNGIAIGISIGAAYSLAALPPLNCELATSAAAASALSPTDAAIGGLSSSRTSMNNSTENLSYASDNFYADDLILLDDDDDVEAEEISLNSDDCVYAYRGDAADFDMAALDASTGRGGRNLDFSLMRDDETDFLEMDFEPDPSSELEFAANAHDSAAAVAAGGHANLLLMQRDYSQLQSGRHMVTPTQPRQLYSSPIEELPLPLPPPQEALQRLSKKFARISLNLDQIKADADANSDLDADELLCGGKDDEDFVDMNKADATTLAHSLPSTLAYNSFNRSTSVPSEHTHATVETCNSKLTGAKPKRLNTLSNSSSLVSGTKNCVSTSKSRRSQPSFDERCYSCTDFRAVSSHQQQQQQPSQNDVAPMLVAAAAVVAASAAMASFSTQYDMGSGEETCLDCLEKEFLANTIGKAIDLSSCAKCRRRLGGRGSSLSLYTRAEQTRCRSGSPAYSDEFGSLFSWHNATGSDMGHYNQRFISCDNNFGGVQLLKQSFSTEPLVARLSTAQLSEDHLVQALDKLHISYNASLLHAYFEQLAMDFPAVGNLKQLLLHVSKRQCNHLQLKKLIELSVQQQPQQQQLNVQFKQENASNEAVVPVKVNDILAAWKRHPDLYVLRQLDARFHRANVLGKIGHIVRQAQQQQQAAAATTSASAAASTSNSSMRHTLPEFIMIPQYYACGELTLTRKC